MKGLGIVVMMAVAVAAYKDRMVLEDFPPYQANRQYSPFHEQHQPFRESFKSIYQSYRPRLYRHDMPRYAEHLSFGDSPAYRDYTLSRSRPQHDDGPFRDSADFKRETPFYFDRPFRSHPAFKNKPILDQSINDQYSYQQPSFGDEFRFSDLYDKGIDSYKAQRESEQFGRNEEYLKHGNHGLGYVSVPPISPYDNALPLNEDAQTTAAPSTVSSATQKSLLQSSVSSTSAAITQVHTSATSKPNAASHSATMQNVKSDTQAEAVATAASTPTVATLPAATAKQSSSLDQAALTTRLPVVATEAPHPSFNGQTLPAIEFHAGKFTTPASYYITSGLKGKLQQSLLSYFLTPPSPPPQLKTAIKSNDQSSLLSYALPDVLNNSLNNKIQSQTHNYVTPEETKVALKDILLHNWLQPEPNSGLSLQKSSLQETNYLPLATALAVRSKVALSSVPVTTLSGISRPLQTLNYLPAAVPKISAFVAQDGAALPLGASLPSTLGGSIPVASSANIFSSLPNGVSGVSAGIANGIVPTVPVSIPTLNLGQNFQHIGQLRQSEVTRSQPISYGTGLQIQNADVGLPIQLTGFGGINYTLRPSNLVAKPLELGITKVGLSLPEITRQQLSAFSKVGLEQQPW